MRALGAVLAILLSLLPGGPATGHALEPGYLEMRALGGDAWRVNWRKPAVQGAPMAIDAVLPEACTPRRPPPVTFDGRAYAAGWVAECPRGLTGGTIRIEGLEATRTDTLVRYELSPGEGQAHRLTASSPAFTVPDDPGRGEVFTAYFGLGVEHILLGLDHLLLVFALLLLIRSRRRLVAAVTAFTVAHSITLGAAAMGWLVVPGPPVEAVVALSIVFLAVEVAKSPEARDRLAEGHPWIVAFGFGLLHGLGFAGALVEIGLPAGEVPLALLAFNLGVEAGQLLFIGIVLALGALVGRLAHREAFREGPPMRVAGYAIGIVGSFWLVERVAAF